MRRLPVLAIVALCVLTVSSVVAQSPPLTPFRGLIDHVSADQWGNVPTENVEVWHGAISGDGRYVVMSTRNPYLANGEYNDNNGYDDVFLRDRMSGWTWLISRPTFGGSADGISQMATISTNGRHIAFASGATNLVPGDTNGRWDVFVFDMDQQRLVRVSVATDGTQGDRDAYYPSISADGRFVAFLSWSTTFASGVSSSAPRQVYLHDRDPDNDGLFDTPGQVTTQLVSAGLTGGIADDSVDSPRVSSDGRVLFESAAANLSDVGNPNAMNHLYLRDRLTSQTTFIDRAVTGGPSQNGVGYGTSDITDDGRWITFSSTSPDLHWFDMNGQSQVFRYDTANGSAFTFIVSQIPDNGPLGDGSSYATSVSADGRYVVFTTAASNLASPPPGAAGPAMLVVRDLYDNSADSFARVDVLDSGAPFDQADYYYTAAVSADGTAIVLQTRSEGAVGDIGTWGASHAVVMTALSATPSSASYPMSGGSGSIEVNATAVSGWNAWSPEPWIVLTEGGGFGAGPRTVQYQVSLNDTGLPRDGSIRVGSKVIPIHQGGGDTTPPIVTPTVAGTLGDNGWYTSDVAVSFSYHDPDSAITSAVGCAPTTQATDTAGTTFSCTVTSDGGSSTVQAIVKRDTTPPSGIIWAPYNEYLHKRFIYYPTDYMCGDSMSGIASCTGPVADGAPLPTGVQGRFSFDVQARDRAGNVGIISKPYYVGSGACEPRPQGLVGWWPGDGHYRDIVARNDGAIVNGGPLFTSGPYSMGFVFIQSRYMWVPDVAALRMDDAFTLSAWVYQVRDWLGPFAVIAGREGEYLLARGPNGNVHYSIANTNPGWGWVDTGVPMPREHWTKLALTYDGSAIRLYKNGQLAYTRAASGVIGDAAPFHNAFQVAARQSTTEPSYFDGTIDDVELVDRAMSAAEIDAAYFSADLGICKLTTTLSFTPTPQRATYGGSAELVARLTNEQAQPIQGEQVQFTFRNVSAGTVLTDAAGVARVPVSIAGLSAQTLVNAAQATHNGTAYLLYSTASSNFVIDRATPVITWNAPAAIVHGAALGGAQLNATANVAGTFAYSPAAGAILPAGSQTLGVTFTPSSQNYSVATGSVPLTVLKATPTVTVTGGTLTYNATARSATGSATGIGGVNLGPLTFTYDGSSTPPVNAGTYAVVGSFAGNSNYEARTGTATLTINKAMPIVPTLNDITETYDGLPHGANVNIAGVAGEWLTPVIMTYNGSTELPVNAGVYAAEVRYDGSANYNAISRTYTLTILKAAPSLTWANPAGIIYGTPLGASQQNAASNVAGSFEYSPAAGTVLNAGTHTLATSFTPSDATNYQTGSLSRSITVSKANAPAVWYRPDDVVYGTPLGPTQLNATAPTPGTFTYSPAAGTVLGAGDHVLSVTFAPDDAANWNGSSALVPFTVIKAGSTVSWNNPADIVYGSALGGSQLNATASVPGTFGYSPASGTVLAAGSHALSVSFTPDDAANYNGASANVSLTVNKAASTINWSNPADIVYGAALGASQLNATANVPGTFAYSPLAGTMLGAGSHSLAVTFTPDDAANYDSASASVSLTVTKAASTISWSNPANIVYGTALGASQLNATANVPGTFSYSPAAGTVPVVGTQSLSVTFTPDDAANYNGAAANVSLTVTQAASTISWSNPANIIYGTALGGSHLNATANVAGTFSYTPAAGAVLAAGSHTLSVTFTPDDAANHNGASSTVSLTVNKADSVVSWNNPAGIVYGAALGAAQLNATANVAGTFNYTPAAGTVLGAGSHTLAVTFTPADAANYNGSSASRPLTVIRAPLTITSNAATKVYGAPLPAFSATGSGFVNGDSIASLTGTLGFTTTATASSAVGGYPITPNGVSSANYTIAFADGTLTVVRASTATAVVASPNPDGLNQAVTFTAVISVVAPGAGAPTGIVQFFDGTTLLGSSAMVGGGASLTTNGLTAGAHSISATYTGDASFAPSSGGGSLTVKTAAQSSTTAVTASANPSNLGQNVTLTATVTAPAGLSGSVAFYDGSTLLATRTLSGTTATFTTNALANGGHAITARYLGNATIPPSTSPGFPQYVKPSGTTTRTSTTALAASPSPAALGSNVTLTATVTGSNNRIPTGQVLFMVNGTIVGQGTVTPIGGLNARTTLSTSTLPRGTHKVEAVYLGDAVVRASARLVTLVVN